MSLPLLKVEKLSVRFPMHGSLPFAKGKYVHAVDNVSFSVGRGVSFGIVGESGSGKSTIALAVMQLIRPTAGSVQLEGKELTSLSSNEMRAVRRRIQMVFQDPFSSLNPRARVGQIIREPLDLMRIGALRERDSRVDTLLELMGLGTRDRSLFPHQFSGGQRQRIAIARALAPGPDLLVCDEPTSALDVAIQAQILNQLSRLQREFGLTYLFISHDLGVIRQMCDEVAVMYFGQIVESGSRSHVLTAPIHPYTRVLLASVPSPDPRRRSLGLRLQATGEPPSPIDPPAGCRFASRCPFAIGRCRDEMPALRSVGEHGRLVRCHRVSGDGIAEYDGQADGFAKHDYRQYQRG